MLYFDGYIMEYFKEDLKRFFRKEESFFGKVKIFMFTPGLWAVVIFRIGSWLHARKHHSIFWRLLLPLATVVQFIITILTGIELPFTAKIGKGLYLGHFGGVIVSHRAILGEYCNLSPGVVIGQAGRGGQQFVPIIGDRVFIGSGAKLFGKIRIGNDVAIGANAVVTSDLPDNAVAVGVPAMIVNYNGSRDFIS